MTDTLARILVAVAVFGGEMMSGFAPRYSPGVMERVATRRGLAPAGCYVSSPFYDIGTRVIVYGANTDRALSCVVADVSHPRDRARHIRTRRVVELGYTEAERLCGTKAMRSRPEACPVTVFRFGS